MTRRLMGQETEYAIRLPAELQSADKKISHCDIYERVADLLKKRIPTAPADITKSSKHGLFLATGGAIWRESLHPLLGFCLIEGSSPECRSPRDLLACQRAQDRLLSGIAEEAGVQLLKNCRDARGNIYGAQESYEVEHTTPAQRKILPYIWGFLVYPVTIAVALSAFLVMLAISLLFLPIGLLIHYSTSHNKSKSQKRDSFDYWVGTMFRGAWNQTDPIVPAVFSRITLVVVMGLMVLPLVIVWLIVESTLLGRLQRKLVSFLVSRTLIAGAGHLDRKGRFLIAEKATGCNRISSMAEYGRVMFSIGHFLKAVVALTPVSEIAGERQRLQISIGDSNMCEEAEYLKIGTTWLMINAAESGVVGPPPQLRFPLWSMRKLIADPTLTKQIRLTDGRLMNAVELQRCYFDYCQRYLDTVEETDVDAADIVQRWDEVLTLFESDRESLVGRIDWVTKEFLLDRAGEGLDRAARKKIDLKYHELTTEGYFHQFSTTGFHHQILEDAEIERAMRLPPTGTRAFQRAIRIRELSGTGTPVSWKTTAGDQTWESR